MLCSMVCLFVLLIATLLFALFRKDAHANQKNYQEVRSEDYILLGSDTMLIYEVTNIFEELQGLRLRLSSLLLLGVSP